MWCMAYAQQLATSLLVVMKGCLRDALQEEEMDMTCHMSLCYFFLFLNSDFDCC